MTTTSQQPAAGEPNPAGQPGGGPEGGLKGLFKYLREEEVD